MYVCMDTCNYLHNYMNSIFLEFSVTCTGNFCEISKIFK